MIDPMDVKIKELLKRARDWRHSSNDLAEAETESVPAELVAKVKRLFSERGSPSCPHCGRPITPFKTPLVKQRIRNAAWAVLAAASFAGSFLAPRYFFQFLVAFLFFGFRWIVDQKVTKTQILIYKALREGDVSEGRNRDDSTFAHHKS